MKGSTGIKVAVVLSLAIAVLMTRAADHGSAGFDGGLFGRALEYFLLLSAAGVLGFGYLGFRQDLASAGNRWLLISILASRVASAFWLLPLVLGGYYSFVPLECAESADQCGLGRGLIYLFSLFAAGVAFVIAGLCWLLYFATRRSAETA